MYYQRQSPLIRPMTTAHLAQTMSLLELTALELRQKVEAELARNPALELIDEHRCPTCQRGPARKLSLSGMQPPTDQLTRAADRFPLIPAGFLPAFSGQLSHRRDISGDDYPPQKVDLVEHILRQIGPELPVEDRQIALHILTSLDDDGFLTVNTTEIAQYHHVPRSRVERIIRQIQSC